MKKRGLGRKNLFFLSIVGGMFTNFLVSRVTNIINLIQEKGVVGIFSAVTYLDFVMIVFAGFLIYYTIKKVQ